jgi:hypothetical protein
MSVDLSKLPNWNARKLREAATPLKGKPLRDIHSYIKSTVDRNRLPNTCMAHAFLRAINLQYPMPINYV